MTRPVPHIYNTLSAAFGNYPIAIPSSQLPSSNCPESFLLLLDAETLCLMDTQNLLMLFFQTESNNIKYKISFKYVSEPNSHLRPNHKNCPPIFAEIAASLAHHQLHSLELMLHHLQPIICFGASNFGRYKNTCLPQISRDSWWGAEILRCCGSHLSISRAKVIRFLLAIIFQISAIVPTSK